MTTSNTFSVDQWATEFKAINGQVNVDEAQGIVECFVAAIGNKDSVGDIITPGAFDGSLRRRKPRVVWGHNWNEPIGKVLEIYEVQPGDTRLPAKMKVAGVGGLYARVQFNLKSERGRQAFLDISFFGEEQEWSIGYKTLNADYDPRRQANVLRELELYEVSPVLHGANQLTSTISIKSHDADGPQMNPTEGRLGLIARALADKVGGSIRIRTVAPTHIVFDHVAPDGDPSNPEDITTQRIGYEIANGMIRFGERFQYTAGRPEADDDDDDWPDVSMKDQETIPGDAEVKAPTPSSAQISRAADVASRATSRVPTGSNLAPDTLPQERITGDVLRGYGPRRGNLERLLRYWRPIMRREGGFRRCLVILADHPELYPLQNLCAWLHHETTGLWPNEGCHHPGMKNCRRKLRQWSNGDFAASLRGRRPDVRPANGKDAREFGELPYDVEALLRDFTTTNPLDADDSNDYDDATLEEANEALAKFLSLHPDLLMHLGDDDNWEVEGDLDEGGYGTHPVMSAKPKGDCGCGCGGAGTCGGGMHHHDDDEDGEARVVRRIIVLPMKGADELVELADLSLEMSTKAGRVLSTSNLQKLQQATNLLREVLQTAGYELEMKDDHHFISAEMHDLFALRETLDPVLEYYGLDAEVHEDGVALWGAEAPEAVDAVKAAVANFATYEAKGLTPSTTKTIK